MGSVSDTSQLTGGSVASNSASAIYCVPGSSDPCSPPVAEWNFEEGQGGTVNDTSGNGNFGTWSGTGSHYTSGKFGKAGNFNGTNDYVTVTDNANLRPGTGDFTVGLWVKLPLTSNGEASGWGTIFDKGLTTSAPAHTWGFTRTALQTNSITFTQSTDGGGAFGALLSTNGLSNGWHYVVARRSGSTTQLFVDGSYFTQDTSAGDNLSSTSNISMGKNPNSYTQYSIDQVRMYNYARSLAQIAWEYNRGATVGWWKFDECQGTVAHDSSTNRNDGNIVIGTGGGTGHQDSVGTCTDGTGATAWNNGAAGKYNSSLKFDGIDDYVVTPRLLTNTTYSISIWINPSRYGSSNYLNGFFYQGSGSSDIGTRFGVGTCPSCTVASGGGKSNTVFFENEGGSTYLSGANSAINLNTWQHVVITKNGANESLYINGSLSNSRANGNTTTPSNNNSYFGFWYSSSDPGRFFQGQIDDVRIYNYALTPVQVKTVMNQGAAVRWGPITGTP